MNSADIHTGLELSPGDYAPVERIVNEYGFVSLRANVDSFRSSLNSVGRVEVGIFGAFKAGKSSLINSIIGETALPVGVVPVTAVPTHVLFGESPGVSVEFKDGAVRDISPGEIEQYVSERFNPSNTRNVAAVSIRTPSMREYGRLIFTDTPGIGSSISGNTDESMRHLPFPGIALVAVSSLQPMSEDDIELVSRLSEHCPEVSLVLTKSDLLSDGELAEVLSHLKAQASKAFNREIPVFPFSTVASDKDARADAWRKNLFSSFLVPLADEASKKAVDIAVYKFRRLLERTAELLELSLVAAEADEQARLRMKEFIADEIRQFAIFSSELDAVFHDFAARIFDEYLKALSGRERTIRKQIMEGFESRWAEWEAQSGDPTDGFCEWLGTELRRVIGKSVSEEKGRLMGPVNYALEKLRKISVNFQDHVASRVKHDFGISFCAGDISVGIETPGFHDISIGQIYDIHWNLIPFVTRLRLVRLLMRRHFRSVIRWEVEKNISRTASQWADLATAAMKRTVGQLKEHMYGQLDTIQSALSTDSAKIERIRSDMSLVAALSKSLSEKIHSVR